MANQSVQKSPAEPEPKFLSYLLSQEHKHDCYFMVGNRKLIQPERIGVVKKMLMAHSEVLRAELEESKLAEKDDVPLEDLYPDTFITFLKYVYGHDTTESLRFDEADNLLYVAEKYMMTVLKSKLSARLITLVSPDNICQLLNNPACYTTLELQSTITGILEYETARVLESPVFLGTSPDTFVKILEQKTMNVEEIQVWRAAVKWAKHKGETDSSKVLRKRLSKPLKHIRVCTLKHEDFFKEVVTTDILTNEELRLVCLYHGTKEKQSELVGVSNETQPRMMSPEETEKLEMNFTNHRSPYVTKDASFTILTKNVKVQILPLEFTANGHPQCQGRQRYMYQCDSSVQIKDITNDAATTNLLTARFSQQVQHGAKFTVPLTDNGRNVQLLPNKKYNVKVSFTQPHTMYYNNNYSYNNNSETYDNNHISVTVAYDSNLGFYLTPVQKLMYQTRKPYV
uniref:BTB domain-containing protein n=1 Tax=Graphocephala atropunctata TaxID=36148 RepID=A0A1B6M7S9_9HEMI